MRARFVVDSLCRDVPKIKRAGLGTHHDSMATRAHTSARRKVEEPAGERIRRRAPMRIHPPETVQQKLFTKRGGIQKWNNVKNFTNFSCEFGGRLLNNALGFSVRRANFNW
jgi:hypothetical protein